MPLVDIPGAKCEKCSYTWSFRKIEDRKTLPKALFCPSCKHPEVL